MGKSAVLRLSFGNMMFFAAHFLVLLGCRSKNDPRRFMHTALWPLQLLAWAALLGVTFAMPNHVFVVWGQVRCCCWAGCHRLPAWQLHSLRRRQSCGLCARFAASCTTC